MKAISNTYSDFIVPALVVGVGGSTVIGYGLLTFVAHGLSEFHMPDAIEASQNAAQPPAARKAAARRISQIAVLFITAPVKVATMPWTVSVPSIAADAMQLSGRNLNLGPDLKAWLTFYTCWWTRGDFGLCERPMHLALHYLLADRTNRAWHTACDADQSKCAAAVGVCFTQTFIATLSTRPYQWWVLWTNTSRLKEAKDFVAMGIGRFERCMLQTMDPQNSAITFAHRHFTNAGIIARGDVNEKLARGASKTAAQDAGAVYIINAAEMAFDNSTRQVAKSFFLEGTKSLGSYIPLAMSVPDLIAPSWPSELVGSANNVTAYLQQNIASATAIIASNPTARLAHAALPDVAPVLAAVLSTSWFGNWEKAVNGLGFGALAQRATDSRAIGQLLPVAAAMGYMNPVAVIDTMVPSFAFPLLHVSMSRPSFILPLAFIGLVDGVVQAFSEKLAESSKDCADTGRTGEYWMNVTAHVISVVTTMSVLGFVAKNAYKLSPASISAVIASQAMSTVSEYALLNVADSYYVRETLIVLVAATPFLFVSAPAAAAFLGAEIGVEAAAYVLPKAAEPVALLASALKEQAEPYVASAVQALDAMWAGVGQVFGEGLKIAGELMSATSDNDTAEL